MIGQIVIAVFGWFSDENEQTNANPNVTPDDRVLLLILTVNRLKYDSTYSFDQLIFHFISDGEEINATVTKMAYRKVAGVKKRQYHYDLYGFWNEQTTFNLVPDNCNNSVNNTAHGYSQIKHLINIRN